MDYRERLIQFNSTEKYLSELKFLSALIGNEPTVLDYGCGIGTAIKYLGQHTESIVRGYDVKCHAEEKSNWFLEHPPQEKYSHIYFMHSLAHIGHPVDVITRLRDNLTDGGKITVITPNLDWLEAVGNTNSDPTVVGHFTARTLRILFEVAGYTTLQQGQFGKLNEELHERLFIQVRR